MGISATCCHHSIEPKTTHKKDILDVTAGYAGLTFPALKAAYVLGIDVPKAAGLIPEDYVGLADDTRYWLNLGKLMEAPHKFLKNSNTLRDKTADLFEKGLSWDKASLDRAYRWVKAANGMVNPTTDMTEFALKSNIYPIPKASFATLKGVNGCAMVFGFGTLAIESLVSLYYNKVDDPTVTGEAEQVEREQAISSLLELGYRVSLCALGALVALSTFFAVVVPSIAFLICSASSVVFHMTKYFYENIGDGMKKNENKEKS